MSNTSPTKTIAINPDFFKITKTKKSKKKKNLEKLLKPNNIKKKLIARIKEHQKKKEKEEKNKKKNEIEFANELQDSIQYLESVTNKIKKEKMQKNLEKKKRREENNNNFSPITDFKEENINDMKISFPTDISISPPPPYSNLKNGSKPTFSQWRSRNKSDEPPQSDIPVHNDSFEERQTKLSIKPTFNNLGKMNSVVPPPKNEPIKKKTKKKTRKVRRRIRLGKTKEGTIGVLIKNKKTRKNIKREISNLKKKSFNNIKKYLRKHNLIKIGNPVPEDIGREIYESAYLSGDIYNKNSDVLLHNYITN